jgi:photosystem II stability/assembly factor-like uncharacterized protein
MRENDWPVQWSFTWATMTEPIVTTPYNPAQPADANLVALGAGNQIRISNDFASSWPSALTLMLPARAGSVYSLRFASAKRLYAGTSRGQVFRADLAGKRWTLTRNDNAARGPHGLIGLISDVEVDWADPSHDAIYVAFGGQGDPRRVWRFDGTAWSARSGSGANTLLDVEHNAIVVDPVAPSNVYVAADLGVWHSQDAGQSWAAMRGGLPEAAVFDLQIHPTQRLLRAATYGRGLYEFPLD